MMARQRNLWKTTTLGWALVEGSRPHMVVVQFFDSVLFLKLTILSDQNHWITPMLELALRTMRSWTRVNYAPFIANDIDRNTDAGGTCRCPVACLAKVAVSDGGNPVCVERGARRQ
jgi:hypothetical protein